METLQALCDHDVPTPYFFSITNSINKRKAYCGVQEFTTPKGTVCMPSWLMNSLALQEGDSIIAQVVPHIKEGKSIRLCPLDKSFYDVADIEEVCMQILKNYVVFAKGDIIVAEIWEMEYKFQIMSCRPNKIIMSTNSNVSIEFEANETQQKKKNETHNRKQKRSMKTIKNIIQRIIDCLMG